MAFRFFRDLINKPNEFSSSEGKESQIMSRIMRGNTVTVKPTSSRFYTRGANGQYQTGDVEMDQYSGGTRAAKPSTAIESVKYDPNTQICSVRFRGGDKSYDYKMTPQDFQSFMNADSKGTYVNTVMKHQNRLPGYGNNSGGSN